MFFEGFSAGDRGLRTCLPGVTASASCIVYAWVLQESRQYLMMKEMFFKHDHTLGGLVLGTLLLLATGSIGATPTTHARFAGTYESRTKGDASSGPSMNVSLGLDGTATVTEDAGNGIVTHFGHWVETDSQVKVSFDPVEGRPAEPPMTLQAEHDGLRAVSWNHATWGKTSPPVVKSRSRVKQRLTDKRSAD